MSAQDKKVIATAYDEIARVYDSQYQSARCDAENRTFFGRTPVDDLVVDIGCGTGLILDYVDIPSNMYVGVDISPGMLKVARERHPEHRFIEADMRTLPFHDGSVGNIVSGFTAYNYVPEHLKVANEFARVLKPGGKLWLNALGPRCVIRETYALYVEGELVPRYPVYAEGLHNVFTQAGFKDISIRGMTLYADRLPDWVPRWATSAFVRLESHTLGRIYPSAGDFILVSATKE